MDLRATPVREQSQRKYVLIVLSILLGSGVLWYAVGRGVESATYLPHTFCYLGNSTLIFTHLSADLVIGFSYVAISLTLAYLVWRNHGSIPFHWMMLAFGTFIIACGGTHFMEAVTLWKPVYWLSAYVKVITAAASLTTAIALPFTVPLIQKKLRDANLSAERKRELESTNEQLQIANAHLAGLAFELRQLDEVKTHALAQGVADVGDWEWDVKSGKITWSKEVELLHGMKPGSFSGRYEDWAKTVHPEHRDEVIGKLLTAMKEHREYEAEYRSLRVDGSSYWAVAHGKFTYGPDGEPLKLVGMCMDVTARRDAQRQIQSQARALDLANDAILILDHMGTIASWNRGAESLYGWSREEAIGKHVSTLLNTRFPKPLEEVLSDLRNSGEWLGELHQTTRTGEEVIVFSRWTLECDPQGAPAGWVEINRDMTHQRKAEDVLRRSEKLAAAGRLAATIAHEINNPLEAVTNLIYLARSEDRLPEDIRQMLDEAENQLSRVSHIARKTLGFYRDTSRPATMSVEKLLDEMLSIYAGRLQSRSIRIIRRYDENSQVEGVPGELVQVFSNLIANAIDASPLGGSLAVRVKKVAGHSLGSGGGIRVTIADSGSGIDRDNRQRIFEPFFTTKKDVGTGLGLWVAAELIRKHKGSIRMRSSTDGPHRGTTFTVFLPFARDAAAVAGSVV